MKLKLWFFILLISACSYSVYNNAYPHLKTLKIETFQNNSDKHPLEDELQESLTNSYNESKRLTIVSKNPDAIISGKILDYDNKIAESSTSIKQEYTVKILFEVQFTDRTKNEVIWQSESLLLSEKYTTGSTESGADLEFHSEEEAVEEIFDDLYDKIMENTLDEW